MKSDIVKDEIVNYINRVQPIQNDAIGELQKYAYENDVPIIDQETARFLGTLLAMKKPQSILEIGCAIGFSSIYMTQFLAEGGKIITLDRFDVMIRQAKANFEKFGVQDKIELIEGDAVEVLENLQGEFDVIFLDAGKGQYVNMLENCIRLLKSGGLLIADDIFQNGKIVADIDTIEKRQRTIHRRMNEFIETINNDPRLDSSLVPIADGVMLAVKK